MSSKVKAVFSSTQTKTVENTDLSEKPHGAYESIYCATCRPCCTLPHGAWSAAVASVATVAWIFTIMSLASCHYMEVDFTWCSAPQPLYGTCGDCHCARGDEPCPTGADVPTTVFYEESVDQWKDLNHTNPIQITCNPYTNSTCDSTPPVELIELWEDAVCAVKFDTTTSLDEDQCPTQYSTQTYPSKVAAEEDGAHVTHWGSCATCSSLQDLSVYVENPDLTSLGQECGIIGLFSLQAGIDCFANAGYTRPCATMWMYNVFQTRDKCFDTCVEFTAEKEPNNSPAPECIIADCLQCDEDYSGPFFKTYAGRTRRRSGLLSKIARPCEAILIVNHVDPCPVRNGTTELIYDQGVKCTGVQTDVGPISYADTESNLFIDLGPFNDRTTALTKSQYHTCARFNFKRSIGGFWDDVEELFGGAQRASSAFIIVASTLGGVSVVLTWATTCAAFRRNFWRAMWICFVVCGVLAPLSLVLYAADACDENETSGCTWKEGSVRPIVAGCLWFVAAVLAFITRQRGGHAEPGRTIACCCCPPAEDDFLYEEKSSLLALDDHTRIETTETIQADGTKVIEKVTTMPNGRKLVETNTVRIAATGVVAKGSVDTSDIDSKPPEEAPTDSGAGDGIEA